MKPPCIVMRPGKKLGPYALARNLYPGLISALAELVFNGLDAANLRGIKPVIRIRTYAAGEHPLFPGSSVISVLDNGTGFTTDVIAAYGVVGDSVHTDKTAIHGKHGVGKLAAFALTANESPSYLITTSTGGKEAWTYTITDEMWDPKGFPPVKAARNHPDLPEEGPYTEILIPDLEEGLTPALVLAELPGLLPLREWEITVNGEPVPQRKWKAQTSFETPSLPTFGGSVRMEFGIAELSSTSDAVELIDAGSKRIVSSLTRTPTATRREIDGALFNPRLVGRIEVPHLEKYSTSFRGGLNAKFWTGRRGRKLVEILNHYGVQEVHKILTEDDVEEKGLVKTMTQIGDLFASEFGPPNRYRHHPDANGKGNGAGGGGGKGGGSGGSGDKGDNDDGGGSDGGNNTPRGTFVKIEDKSYRVMSYPVSNKMPATVRPGNVIVLNTSHPELKRLQKLNAPRVLLESVLEFLIMAHVAEQRRVSANDFFGEVLSLKTRVLSRKPK